MHREPDGLIISLREVGFFESGSAQMKAEAQAAFDRIAAMLRKGDYRLRIEATPIMLPFTPRSFPRTGNCLLPGPLKSCGCSLFATGSLPIV